MLFAGGWSLLLLALFYWVIDVQGYRKWTFFFVVIGMNAITIYFLQNLRRFRARSASSSSAASPGTPAVYAALLLPLGAFAARWLFLWFLYRHKIFFKV